MIGGEKRRDGVGFGDGREGRWVGLGWMTWMDDLDGFTGWRYIIR